MPLTRRQFELGIDDEGESWMRQVYELLSSRKELAYSRRELGQHVLDRPGKSDVFDKDATMRAKFERGLEILQVLGAIEKRELGDTDYYAFYEGIDTISWQRKARV